MEADFATKVEAEFNKMIDRASTELDKGSN
jgi:hypothetical protein